MDAGLSSLTKLKEWVLADAERASLAYDDALTSIGLGVRGAMERYTGRQFERTVGAQTTVESADRTMFILPRYPIEELSAIEVRTRHADEWEAQVVGDVLAQLDEESGLVILETPLGLRTSQIRFTYTAGWWWDTSEDASGELPSGATAVPADVVLAWRLQVEEIWARRDKLGIGLTAAPAAQSKLTELDLVPEVRRILAAHQRYAG